MNRRGASSRLALSLYPPAWRARYGEEAAQLAEDLLASGRHPLGIFVNLLLGALRERLRPPRRGLPAVRVPTDQRYLWRHRDAFGRRGLDGRAGALFEPSEQIRATFGGCAGFPVVRYAARSLVTFAVGSGGFYAFALPRQRSPLMREVDTHGLEIALVVLATGCILLIALRLGGGRRIMVAVTTHGVVECGLDWLGRPRVMLERGPATRPQISTRRGGTYVRAELGPIIVHTHRRNERVLHASFQPWQTRTVVA